MKLAQQAMWSLFFAMALVVFGHGDVLGDAPEPQFGAHDEAVVAEEAASGDSIAAASVAPGLLSDRTSIPLPETIDDTSPPQVNTEGDTTGNPAPELDGAMIDSQSNTAADLGVENNIPREQTPREIAADNESESFTTSGVNHQITSCQPEDPPCPEVGGFPISRDACCVHRPGTVSPNSTNSGEKPNGTIQSDETSETGSTTDGGWLMEKLDGYRDANIEDEVPAATVVIDHPPACTVPIQPVSEPRMPISPTTVVTPAASIRTIPPSSVTPPATIVPPAPLTQALDQRWIAALYGVFVGILATLFLLLISLVLRGLANRIIPRRVAVPPGSFAETYQQGQQETGMTSQQRMAGSSQQPYPAYMAYPQQAYMPPFMMHPSFVYADVDPHQEERPRRPKTKSNSQRKRRGGSTGKRKRRVDATPSQEVEAEHFAETDTTSFAETNTKRNREDFKPESFGDHPAASQDTQARVGVFTKILEQNLRIRETDDL